ncbi:major facilitator superfamily domain-containing protein [Echria macrotheca]|uniref:Major facilitator superfamily domain-containing protein n=1 Tax=Echria macrotheca TaxID=438768 RepID=A0AAJ0B963_9PEZI|nr:major facilitator superfamily domain-containing protein [Echria macrotheca]
MAEQKDFHRNGSIPSESCSSPGTPLPIVTVSESQLRTKIDLRLVPTVAILYLFCFIDRANIGNAKISNMDKDIHMTGYDYNLIISAFYVGYIVLEIPAVILCKRIGPAKFLPTTCVLFGLCSVGTAFVTTVPEACGVRFLLGIFEAGMLPGVAYYLSRWYRRAELTFRLSLYVVMAPIAGAFGGLLASAILTLPHFGGLTSWRMLFAIEGLITIGVSFLSYFVLSDSPATAKWLNEAERALAVARIEAERDETPLLDTLSSRRFLRGAFSPVTLTVGFVFLLNAMTVQCFAFFLPTIVKTIYPDFTTVQQQLYTAPPNVFGAVVMVSCAYLSWKTDRRQIYFIISTPLVIAGYVMFLASADPRVRYGATFLVASAFTIGALANAQVAANVCSDSARSAAIGVTTMGAHLGGLVGSWSFLPWDAPDYRLGNGLNLGTSGLILVLSCLLLAWMKWDNKKRDKRASEGGDEGVPGDREGVERKDLEWKSPTFRWRS